MTESGVPPLLAAAAYLLPALVWAVVAQAAWHLRRVKQSQSGLFRLLPILASFATLLYAFLVLFCLIPRALHRNPPGALIALYVASDLTHVGMAATLRHLAL